MDLPSGQSSPTIHDTFPLSSQQSINISTPIISHRCITRAQMEDVNIKHAAPERDDARNVTPESFFDLRPPPSKPKQSGIEDLMQRLFSSEHLHFILEDPALLHRFSTFLNRYRPDLVPTLSRYLDMRKAMKAIEYANAVARSIRWPSHTDYCKFARIQAALPDFQFEDYAARELLLLVTEALPAFVTEALVSVVSECVAREITGQGIPFMDEVVGSLAEVFCLTDPSIHDNPIIYASEEFYKTTQYGTNYAIDRNCRFLQGPATDKNCTLRLARAILRGEESNELILNYRRDGTPFANLLMCCPLYDDKGKIKYFIGAQVDVTGLVEFGRGIDSFRHLLQRDRKTTPENNNGPEFSIQKKDSWLARKAKETLERLRELSTMFSQEEADIANNNSRSSEDTSDAGSIGSSNVPTSGRSRVPKKRLIGDNLNDGLDSSQLNIGNTLHTNLPGIYQHYLLVRPYPSLRIMFVSPSLRLPGLLRTQLFSKIGGSSKTIQGLQSAFQDGASVTAKILWLPRSLQAGEGGKVTAEAKPRWIRCSPLLGSDDRVGVWMVIIVPSMEETGYGGGRPYVAEQMQTERSISRASRSATGVPASRGESVADGGGLGSRRYAGSSTATRRDEDDSQLYADYLRNSSSTRSRGERSRRRKESIATDGG